MNFTEVLEQEAKRDDLPDFAVGDDVEVAVNVKEGDRERAQVFSGTVIAKKGRGTSQTFTVRKVVQGEGVERVFPLYSPAIASIKVSRKGKVKQSKLYYLRERVGKATKVKETLLTEGALEGEPAEEELEGEEMETPEEAEKSGEEAEEPSEDGEPKEEENT